MQIKNKREISPRRDFLKKSGSIVAVAGAVAITAGCTTDKLTHLSNKKSKKEEILYQKSPDWALYYSVAK